MIKKITLINFRNFENKSFNFEEETNIIIWKNWKGKTNILEGISLLSNNSLLDIDFSNLVKKNKDFLYIQIKLFSWEKLWISFDKTLKKKKFFINKKSISKNKLKQYFPKIVSFHPMLMNIMYLSPSLRRNFLDSILTNSFPEYNKILIDFKKILRNRNKLLKNIFEKKSKKEEIIFWDKKFIEKADSIYIYREQIIKFIEKETPKLKRYFENKINKIEFIYKTKIDRNNIKNSIKEYLNKNLERDIILKKTFIWPHLDDFDIILDNNISIINFASRWEIKSIILWLKFIEAKFLKKVTNKTPIFIIDDLLSEIDSIHRNILIKNIKNKQTFITTINDIEYNSNKIFL